MVLEVAQHQALGRFSAELPSTWRRHGAGVDGKEIAAGGQDVKATARGRAGGAGGDEFAIQRVEEGQHLRGPGGGQAWLYERIDRVEDSPRGRPFRWAGERAGDQIGGDDFELLDNVANASRRRARSRFMNAL
ncbi:hypothetical protein D3C87_1828250 [compost metagenome]